MRAIEILRDSLFAILKNWRQAIRIFLLPLGLAIGVFVSALTFGSQTVTIGGQAAQAPSPFLFVLVPVLLFLIFWPVVAWHRLLILDDQPSGFVPPFRVKVVARYVLNVLGLGVAYLLLMLPITAIVGQMMIIGLDLESIAARGGMLPLKFFIWPTVASLPVLYLGIRLCLILPGAAVENHIGLSGSWQYTSNKGASLPLIVVFAGTVSVVSQIFFSAITPSLLEASRGIFTVLQVTQSIGQLLGSLFVISVMSTLFLVFVQDRPTD